MTNNYDDEDGIELLPARPERYAPYLKVFPLEMLDSRIGANEKILLQWLRFRCSTKDSNFVSFRILAEDFGVNEATVYRWAKNLKDAGWMKCTSRGFGKAKRKFIIDPQDHYDSIHLLNVWKYCKRERSQEDINALRSIDNADKTHYSQNCEAVPCKSASTDLADLQCEVDQVKQHSPSGEVDQNTRLASPIDQIRDLRSDQDLTNKDQIENRKDPFGTLLRDQDPEKEKRDAAVQAALQAGLDRTAAAAAQVAQRRTEKLQQRQGVDEKKREKATFREVGHDGCNSVDVERWLTDGIRDHVGDFVIAKWEPKSKERSLAKKLLDQYTSKIVKLTIDYVCKNWVEVAKRFNKSPPAPTIGWLYLMRETIVLEAQAKSGSKKIKGKPDGFSEEGW